jgi:hypothetical protein
LRPGGAIRRAFSFGVIAAASSVDRPRLKSVDRAAKGLSASFCFDGDSPSGTMMTCLLLAVSGHSIRSIFVIGSRPRAVKSAPLMPDEQQTRQGPKDVL